MKKSLLTSIVLASSLSLIISCASTSSAKSENENKSNRSLKVISTETAAQKTETAADLYAKKIEGIKLTAVSSPANTTAGKAFASPFTFRALKTDGTPVAGLELSVNYPETKAGTKVNFGLASLTTDETGTAVFTAPVPAYAYNSTISVYITGDVTDPEIAKIASSSAVTVPYKAKTNKLTAGGTIAIVDFTADGKPVTNNSVSSSKLLTAMMQQGFKRIGNADFTNAILQDDPAVVYKAAKNLLGNVSSFLVFGTVKYVSPVEKLEDGKFSLTLVAKVSALDMKTGNVVYTTEKTVTQVEDKEWNCLPNARVTLQNAIAPELLYEL